jgi:hypothetical protein
MTANLDLPPEIEARFRAEAQDRGVSIDAFLREYLIRYAPIGPPAKLDAEELERAFDELALLIPQGTPPLSDEALSRESIYTREDEV